MRLLIPCYAFLLVLMELVQLSLQQDGGGGQSCNDDIMNAIINLESRLDEKLAFFLEDKMVNLLEEKMSDLLEDQMTALFENKTTGLDDIIADLEESMPNLLKDKMSELNDTLSNVLSEYQLIKDTFGKPDKSSSKATENSARCPVEDEFFVAWAPGPGKPRQQCLKSFRDARRTWFEADAKCKSEGLQLARPEDGRAVREYIVRKYKGHTMNWIGARGDGVVIRWNRNQEVMYTGNRNKNVTSDQCLELYTTGFGLVEYYNSPYNINDCSVESYILCELIME